MQLNPPRWDGRITHQISEVIRNDQEDPMTELSETRAEMIEQPAADDTANLAQANHRAMNFLFGAQRLMLEELVFVSNEMLDRMRTETHLFTEFASKLAEAHSVSNIRTMWEECGRHQVDFIRRDAERFFKHGERTIENMSKLIQGRLSG
jgi:hypothetical protein